MDSEETQGESSPSVYVQTGGKERWLLSQGCVNRKQPTGGLGKDFTAQNKERDKGLNIQETSWF